MCHRLEFAVTWARRNALDDPNENPRGPVTAGIRVTTNVSEAIALLETSEIVYPVRVSIFDDAAGRAILTFQANWEKDADTIRRAMRALHEEFSREPCLCRNIILKTP